MKKTEHCSHRTQSNPIQSMDGSNPCPTLLQSAFKMSITSSHACFEVAHTPLVGGYDWTWHLEKLCIQCV